MKTLLTMAGLMAASAVYAQTQTYKQYDYNNGVRSTNPVKEIVIEGNEIKEYRYNQYGVRDINPAGSGTRDNGDNGRTYQPLQYSTPQQSTDYNQYNYNRSNKRRDD